MNENWIIKGSLDCPNITSKTYYFDLTNAKIKNIPIPKNIDCNLTISEITILINSNNKEEYTLIQKDQFFKTNQAQKKVIEYQKKDKNGIKNVFISLNFLNEINMILLNISDKEFLNNEIYPHHVFEVSNTDNIKITSSSINKDYAYFIIENKNINNIIFLNQKNKITDNKIEIIEKSYLFLKDNHIEANSINTCENNLTLRRLDRCILILKNNHNEMGSHGGNIELDFQIGVAKKIKYIIQVYVEKYLFITGDYQVPCENGKSKWDGNHLSCYSNNFHEFFDYNESMNYNSNNSSYTYKDNLINYQFVNIYQTINTKYLRTLRENINNNTIQQPTKDIVFSNSKNNELPKIELNIKSNWKFQKANFTNQTKIHIFLGSEQKYLDSFKKIIIKDKSIYNEYYFKNDNKNYHSFDPNFYEIITIPIDNKLNLKLKSFIKCNITTLYDLKSFRSEYHCHNQKVAPELNLIFEPHENEELVNLEVNKNYKTELKLDIINSSLKVGEINFEFTIRKDENNILYIEKKYKVSETI